MGCTASSPGHVASAAEVYVPSDEAQAVDAIVRSAPCAFHREFALGRRLGSGAFGCVYAAKRAQGGQSVAVKIVDPRAEDEEGQKTDRISTRKLRAVEREAAVMRSLPPSPNIVAFYGAALGDGLAYLVMERCTSGLLAVLQRMPALTEASLKPVFQDMLAGIAVCHTAGIVHRDVKCDNFLATATPGSSRGFVVKLCDFGLASRVSSAEANELNGVFGTPPYMAPEMLDGKSYNAKVDVWALGVLAYVLLYGSWPYVPAMLTGPAMKDAIRVGLPAPAFRAKAELPKISEDCSKWVKALLRRDPARRLSAEQALHLKSFHRDWEATAPLDKTLRAAARMGAFELRAADATGDGFEAKLLRLNAKCRDGLSPALSEASTNTGSDSHATSHR